MHALFWCEVVDYVNFKLSTSKGFIRHKYTKAKQKHATRVSEIYFPHIFHLERNITTLVTERCKNILMHRSSILLQFPESNTSRN